MKLNTTEAQYYALAGRSKRDKSAVIHYYEKCIRLARFNNESVDRFKQVLAIMRKVEISIQTRTQ